MDRSIPVVIDVVAGMNITDVSLREKYFADAAKRVAIARTNNIPVAFVTDTFLQPKWQLQFSELFKALDMRPGEAIHQGDIMRASRMDMQKLVQKLSERLRGPKGLGAPVSAANIALFTTEAALKYLWLNVVAAEIQDGFLAINIEALRALYGPQAVEFEQCAIAVNGEQRVFKVYSETPSDAGEFDAKFKSLQETAKKA